jgi:hypothetical protein
LTGLLEYFAVTSSTFQSLLVLNVQITICTAQLQLCKDLMLAATSSARGKDLKLVAAGWNISQQNKSNRRRTANRARAPIIGAAALLNCKPLIRVLGL